MDEILEFSPVLEKKPLVESQEEESGSYAKGLIKTIEELKVKAGSLRGKVDGVDVNQIERLAVIGDRLRRQDELTEFLTGDPTECKKIFQEIWREYYLKELANGRTIESLRKAEKKGGPNGPEG